MVALRSILAQTRADLEVIVVDDGSVDRTPEVVQDARSGDPRVRSLRHARPIGAAAARNAGAAQAHGDYLLFEDDDCHSAPNKIQLLLDALDASPEAAYAYCWMLLRSSDGSVNTYGDVGPWSISTSCALLRRQAFEEVGGFDPHLPRLQDFDLWTRLLSRFSAVEVPEVLFEMLRDDAGISASDDRLITAAEILLTKYRRSDMPAPHISAMHRRVGGGLLLAGFRGLGVAHYRMAIRSHRRSVRSWIGLAAALIGSRFYRLLLRTGLPHRLLAPWRAGGGSQRRQT